MRQHTAVIALFLFGGVFVLGLLALASMLGPGVSQADDATMHNCPQPSRWAVAVWGGDDGTNADQAFTTCGEGAVIAAYDLDPQTQAWSRWFADQPGISTLSTLDKWQGVIALGAVGASPPSPTPTPTPTVPTPSPTPSPAPGTGLSRNNPVAFGQTLTVPPGWEITALDVDWDAWPEVHAENMFNEPPEEGYRMVMVTVRAKNVQSGDQSDWISDSDFLMVGSRNIVYPTFGLWCGVIPDELAGEVFPGGTVEGNVCFQAGIDETNLLLIAALEWSDQDRRYFALQ